MKSSICFPLGHLAGLAVGLDIQEVSLGSLSLLPPQTWSTQPSGSWLHMGKLCSRGFEGSEVGVRRQGREGNSSLFGPLG